MQKKLQIKKLPIMDVLIVVLGYVHLRAMVVVKEVVVIVVLEVVHRIVQEDVQEQQKDLILLLIQLPIHKEL